MKKLVNVEAKALADIRGKELLYVIIGEENKVIINVGQKTYDQVKELLEKTARPAAEQGQDQITKILIQPEEGKKK